MAIVLGGCVGWSGRVSHFWVGVLWVFRLGGMKRQGLDRQKHTCGKVVWQLLSPCFSTMVCRYVCVPKSLGESHCFSLCGCEITGYQSLRCQNGWQRCLLATCSLANQRSVSFVYDKSCCISHRRLKPAFFILPFLCMPANFGHTTLSE